MREKARSTLKRSNVQRSHASSTHEPFNASMLKLMLKRWLPPLFSLLLIALLAQRLDLRRIGGTMGSIPTDALLSALSLSVPFVLLKVAKWRRLLRHSFPETPWRLAFRSFLTGMALSLLTPARLGELGRAACFPGKRLAVTALTLVDKLMDATALVSLAFLSVVMLFPRWRTVGMLLMVGVGVLAWAGMNWMSRSPGLARWRWLAEPLSILRNLPRRLVLMNLGTSAVCFGLMMTQFHRLLSGLIAQPMSWEKALVLPVILLISSLPITVAGLGLREAVAAMLLSHYQVPVESAVVAVFLLFVTNSVLPGWMGLMLDAIRGLQ